MERKPTKVGFTTKRVLKKKNYLKKYLDYRITTMVSDALKRAQTKYRLKNKETFSEYSRACYHKDPEARKRTLTIYRLKKGQKVKDQTLEKYGLIRSDYDEKPLKEQEKPEVEQ